ALVENDSAHQLNVEEPDADRPLERLADGGERLEQEVFELLAVLQPLPELGGLGGELLVGELLEVGLERADVRGLLGAALPATALSEPKELVEAIGSRHPGQGNGCFVGR